MPRFAANLTTMFNEVVFLDRFERAAAAGFDAVEFLFPYEFPIEAIAERLERYRLDLAVFNLPPGDWIAGERGIACLADRIDEVLAGLNTALPYAKATGARRLHLLAGLGDRRDHKQRTAYMSALLEVGGRLADEGLDLLIEPINRRDVPGYFLDDFAFAADLIAGLGLDNLKLQFDIYHRQILHGDVTVGLRSLMPIIGHIQIASVPSRHEPEGGELNFAFLFGELDRLGYEGFIGCEYRPVGDTESGLEWFRPYARREDT